MYPYRVCEHLIENALFSQFLSFSLGSENARDHGKSREWETDFDRGSKWYQKWRGWRGSRLSESSSDKNAREQEKIEKFSTDYTVFIPYS